MNKKKLLIPKLLGHDDYRSFMRTLIEGDGPTITRGVYTAVANKSGFSSRTFVRDIVLGKRRVTPKTIATLARGLGLKGDLQTFFKLLVWKEEEDCRPPGLGLVQIGQKISRLKEKLLSSERSNEVGKGMIEKKSWPEVYAGLGSRDTGATLEQVQKRCRLKMETIRPILQNMLQEGVVTFHEATACYRPCIVHPSSIFGGQSHAQFFLRGMEGLNARVSKNFASSDHLYWRSVFSLRSEHAAQFKKELRDLILKFTDHAEDENGDTVGQILIAFERELGSAA